MKRSCSSHTTPTSTTYASTAMMTNLVSSGTRASYAVPKANRSVLLAFLVGDPRVSVCNQVRPRAASDANPSSREAGRRDPAGHDDSIAFENRELASDDGGRRVGDYGHTATRHGD